MPVRAANNRAIKAVQSLYSGGGMGATLPSASGTAWGLVDGFPPARDTQHFCAPVSRNLDYIGIGIATYNVDSQCFGCR